MIGVGEFVIGGFVTTALDPIEIARDIAPVMEALRPTKLPIQFPTAMSGFRVSYTIFTNRSGSMN